MVKKGYDIAVIGGGPAGLTAAYYAARSGGNVLLLDRMDPPGEKILLSGGGRCNLLPREVTSTLYTTDSSPHTLRKILLSWPIKEVRAFLENTVGVDLIEEKKTGKIYPRSQQGKEVRDRLLTAAKRAGVRVQTKVNVVDLIPGKNQAKAIVLETGKNLFANRVILATGGLSYPQTGSDGTGLEIARRLGHHLVPPYPALCPLQGGSARHHQLAGLSVPVLLTVGQGRSRVQQSGSFLFTHRGYSGPVVLNMAHLATRATLAGDHPPITVTWGEIPEAVWQKALSPRRKTVRGALKDRLPDRLVDLLLSELDLLNANLSTLKKGERLQLIAALTAYPLPWKHNGGFQDAEVTGGGVSLTEVAPRTLQSRVVSAVYLCGEILDAFGPIGGTNFLWAFVTGKLAGEGASQDLCGAR